MTKPKNMLKPISLLFFLSAALGLTGCSKHDVLTEEGVADYFALSEPGQTDESACQKAFSAIKASVKRVSPTLLETLYLYTGRSHYSPQEVRGLIRLSLLWKARNLPADQSMVALLSPALEEFLAIDSTLLSPLQNSTSINRSEALTVINAGVVRLALSQAIALRATQEKAAQDFLVDFRMALLGLPEEKCEVVNLTPLLWEESNKNGNNYD